MQDIVQAIGQVSLFGQCDVSDLRSVESERRERERKIQLEKEKRFEETRIAEIRRKQQEEEDYMFALNEQETLNALYQSPSKTVGRGRGAKITRLLESSPPPNLPQGRGRFSRQSNNNQFIRENILADQITQTTGGEQIYRNSIQEQYWQGDSSVNYTFQDICSSNQITGDDAAACNENIPNDNHYNDTLPSTTFSNEDPASSDLDNGACATHQPDCHSSNSDLMINCDQFDDAESSLSTYMSVKQEISPFESAPSSVRASPEQPPPLPSGQLSRKPPRSRIAAKFSTPISTSTKNSNVSHYDFFAEPSTQHRIKPPSHYSGISINSITASQRIIGEGQVRSIDLFNNYKSYYGNYGDFHLNQDEFPPL